MRDAILVTPCIFSYFFAMFTPTHELLHKVYYDFVGIPCMVIGNVTVAPLLLGSPHFLTASMFPYLIPFLTCLFSLCLVEKELRVAPLTLLVFLFLCGCEEVFWNVTLTMLQLVFLL